MKVTTRNFALVLRTLDQTPARVNSAARTGLKRGLLIAAGIAQREFLSGPRPEKLDVRTTRLRNSISTEVEQLPDRVKGKIGSNVAYAAYHEFGFHGTQTVRAHTRVLQTLVKNQNLIGPGYVAVDTRRQLFDAKGNFIGMRDTKKRDAGRRRKNAIILVDFRASYQRKVNYAGRPYVRPAVRKAMPQIVTEIQKDITDEVIEQR